MTDDELRDVLRLVEVLWPQAKDDPTRLAAGWAMVLGHLDAGPVTDAVTSLAAQGREWPPPPGVVYAEVCSPTRSALARARAAGQLVQGGSRAAALDSGAPAAMPSTHHDVLSGGAEEVEHR